MTAIMWSTIASLATALGTLILAVATFSAVRSSNLMARVAREQLLVQLRPVLTTSRREDPALKVNFGDSKWVQIPGGGAVGEVGPGDGSLGPDTPVVYLAMPRWMNSSGRTGSVHSGRRHQSGTRTASRGGWPRRAGTGTSTGPTRGESPVGAAQGIPSSRC